MNKNKKFKSEKYETKFNYEDFFGSADNISSSAWTKNISQVNVTHSQDGKGKYEITFKNGESISVTYEELHSQSKMAKKMFSKFMVPPLRLIPSEYEKVENFVILKERLPVKKKIFDKFFFLN